MRSARRLLALLVTSCLAIAGLTTTASAAPDFAVLAFYSGTWDAAHIDFVKEANEKFPQFAAQNNFSYTATNDWNRLNNLSASQYQVVMFLDDLPGSAAQRAGFQRYMDNGGAFFGFHVSAFTTDPGSWSWYHNTFLGSGAFHSNTWGPTTAVLKVENRTHPSTVHLPATFTSAVSEWYSWNNDLRNNPNINILASVDPSSFPLGTDPNQTWYSGYYPILWTNKNYKMLYANFGHNAMNYETNTRLSSTFASATQNTFLIDGLKWLGGAGTTPPVDQPSPTAWYSLANKSDNRCVDARAAGTANGTVIQQYSCNSTQAQQFQFQPTSDGYTRVNNRNDPAKAIDVTGVSLAENAGLQLWSYVGGSNQQWKAVSEGSGYFHLVARHSSKCLTSPGGGDGVQLVQRTCSGAATQSFLLQQH